MSIRKVHKTFIIIVFSILTVSLLPGAAVVWAEAGSRLAESGFDSGLLTPLFQGEESMVRPPASVDDMIVQFGEDAEQISIQSDNSGVEIVPGAAFVHTGELGTGTEAEDWFFSFFGGYVKNKNASTNSVCLMAPVYLPLDSTITSFTVYLYDNFAGNSTFVYLDRTGSRGGWDELARVVSSTSTSIQVLTDPSIYSGDDAHIVAPEYNYQVDFCLPVGSGSDTLVYGAKVGYIPKGDGLPVTRVYLPIIISGESTSSPAFVYITNLTGGDLTYTIKNTPEWGDITCVIPNNAVQQLCNVDKGFSPDYYDWTAQAHCGSTGGTKYFASGPNYPKEFKCE